MNKNECSVYGIWERSILKTLYMCEICGRQSEDKEEIEKCENVGVPVPLVKVGDLIFFKDCKETPILFENEKILTEFDEYVAFFDDLNTVSNSYKHSLCTFSPSKADGDIFISYTLKDSDVDKEISQNEIIETVEMNRLD